MSQQKLARYYLLPTIGRLSLCTVVWRTYVTRLFGVIFRPFQSCPYDYQNNCARVRATSIVGILTIIADGNSKYGTTPPTSPSPPQIHPSSIPSVSMPTLWSVMQCSAASSSAPLDADWAVAMVYSEDKDFRGYSPLKLMNIRGEEGGGGVLYSSPSSKSCPSYYSLGLFLSSALKEYSSPSSCPLDTAP